MPSLTADAIGSPSLPQGTSKKRSLPDDTQASEAKKLKLEESSAHARDKKDKKRRKRKRKPSVVEAGSKSPSAPNSFATRKETSGPPSVSSSPAPILPPPPSHFPDTLPTPTIKTPPPEPEFIQGSSSSQGAWSPFRATPMSTLPKTAMEASATHSPQENELHLKETLATTSEVRALVIIKSYQFH